MTKENKKTKDEKNQDKIMALKAKVYDHIAGIEARAQQDQAAKEAIIEINKQIAKLMKGTS